MKTINKYIRNKNGERIGELVATCPPTIEDMRTIGIGWSLCRKSDRYDQKFGHNIAYDRAMVHVDRKINDETFWPSVPQSLTEDVKCFAERATRYFKVNKTTVDCYR